MSATNAPFGFICAKNPSGQSRANEYTIATGYAANIFQGDPVKLVTAGTIQLGTSDGTRTGTFDNISLLGVFAGCVYTDSTGKPNWSTYWPASTTATDIKAYVYDNPDEMFVVQADGSIAAAGLGDQADWSGANTAGGGSTATGRSTATLSSTLVGAGQQGQFRIVEIDRSVDNAAGDSYTKVIVQIAEHQYRAEATAV
jgi:hypothetical protein